MATNAISNSGLKVNTVKRADDREKSVNESCAPVTLKHRLAKLLHEVFEGREEYLGMTPD